jgi:uncharacterized protein (DUF305 family)
MIFKKNLLLSALLIGGLVSCGSVDSDYTGGVEPAGDAAADASSAGGEGQAPMAGMDHSSMNSGGMTGMDHSQMTLGPKDESFDLRFIDGMVPHHEGAVLMANEALEKSDRAEIRELSQAIIEAQESEIGQLQEWRTAWYPSAGSEPMMWHEEMNHMMAMTDEMRDMMMMSGELGEAGDEFDKRFIDAMIPHHEGAVTMAKEALANSDRPEIKAMAEAMIASQQQEIDQMKQWRVAWYGS